MKSRTRTGMAAALGAALAAALAAPVLAFSGVDVGDLVENAELASLSGGSRPFLGKARANVFVFFRPGQDHSIDVLRQLAALEKELAGKSVSFSAIVSDGWPAEEVRAAVAASGIRMPVLVDRGDALYGRLGVRLHPVIGIVDERHRLAAYQPYERIHYADVVRARIQRVLGEIDDAALAAVLDPPRATMPDEDVRFVAKRDVNLGRMLLARGNFEKALESARRAQQRDPTFAAAHTLAGQALVGMGRYAEAAAELDAALKLDPGDAVAANARKACR